MKIVLRKFCAFYCIAKFFLAIRKKNILSSSEQHAANIQVEVTTAPSGIVSSIVDSNNASGS